MDHEENCQFIIQFNKLSWRIKLNVTFLSKLLLLWSQTDFVCPSAAQGSVVVTFYKNSYGRSCFLSFLDKVLNQFSRKKRIINNGFCSYKKVVQKFLLYILIAWPDRHRSYKNHPYTIYWQPLVTKLLRHEVHIV